MGAARPGAGPLPPRLRRVLVVKLSALGDVAHALPVIEFLAKAAPGIEVDWAVDRGFAPLLEGNPALRRVVPLDIRRWKRKWSTADARREALAGVRQLRRGRYDAAFDIQGNAKSGLVTRLSGAPLRFGFDRGGVRELPNLLFTNRKVALLPGDRHIVRKYLRVVSAPFGGTFDPRELRPTVATSAADASTAARIVSELLPGASPRVALHAGSTWETKRMDPAFWAGAVRSLRARFPDLGVLLSWGSGHERREAEEIRALAEGTVEILPRLSLKQLAALYREVGHVMAPDTGPLHVAAAAGAKTVSVFRATDGNRNAPCGPGHRFLQAPLPCTACLLKHCPRDAECRASIPPSAVAEALCRVMAGVPGAAGER
jgi:heptosyltransferase I